MKFIEYLENLEFESLISTTFLLPFFGLIIILKILSVILYSFAIEDDEDESPKVTVFSNWFAYFIFSFVVLIMYDYFDRKEKLDFRFTNKIVTEHHNQTYSVNNDSENNETLEGINIDNETFSWNDIEITPEAENLVNNAKLTEKYDGLSSEDLIKIKKIMSDPNPDPFMRNGETCSMGIKECKWCGKEISIDGTINTSKDLLRLVVKPKSDDPLEILAAVYGAFTVSPKSCIESYELADNHNRKYQCIVNREKEFCSLKCEKEFKNNRGY
ncbi:hypothetical protein [uncultured Chryseobacterium sp.]|uniref:hypothetical protein n=1 Tax=uncultured Chryseobacterium sp. TaxID=259322 RepID=UPI00258D623E|nr:hypothetical protein [uncultured Chryseobacterium sp.]